MVDISTIAQNNDLSSSLEKLFPFFHGTSKQGINVKTGHSEVIDRENKK